MNNIPIYVINLRRTPERRLHIQRQLDSLALNYQIIEAVDVHDFKDTELSGVDLTDEYQPGAMACLLSHVKIYDQIIQNNHQITCVLEDDAQLTPSFAGILNYEELKKLDWGVLLLAHQSDVTTNLLIRYYRYNFKSKEVAIYDMYNFGSMAKNPVPIYMKNHYMAKPQGGSKLLGPKSTMAYLIKLSTAKKLRKIAVHNQKSIYIDDITGGATNYGVSLKLITPPCVKATNIYSIESLICKTQEKMTQEDINTSKLPLPDEKLIRFYIRNQWKALIISFSTLRIRLGLCFFINLAGLKFKKIREIFIPIKMPR